MKRKSSNSRSIAELLNQGERLPEEVFEECLEIVGNWPSQKKARAIVALKDVESEAT